MFNVEQFIYTTASIENKKGYQIVAKSEGITEEIIDELESYVYPIDIEPSKFSDSRSFVLLKKDLAAYSRIKNIGLGHDGRENTLYNHTFVFSKADFEKHDYNTRIFDKFYLEDKTVRGILPTLTIESSSQSFPLSFEKLESKLEEILCFVFMNKKIALLFDDIEFPQKILSLLPKSMRLIPYSTFVIEPKKQPKYHLILNSKLNKSKLGNDFEIISPNESSKFHDKTIFEQSISYYVQLIKTRNYEELKELQNLFDSIPGKSDKNKIILSSNYIQFKNSNDEEKRSLYADKMLEVLRQFDQNTFSYYFEKIKDSLKEYKKLESKLPELNPSMSFMEAFFFLPTKIMTDIYNAFITQQNKKDEE